MSVPEPYHIHRQWHLGDILDELQQAGHLDWTWIDANHRVTFEITEAGQPTRKLGILGAEAVAVRLVNRERIVWIPVPHRGGLEQYEETKALMRAMEEGAARKPWEQA